jgi:hypothetical protein
MKLWTRKKVGVYLLSKQMNKRRKDRLITFLIPHGGKEIGRVFPNTVR